MALVGSNFEIIFFDTDVLELNGSEFADPKPCLEEEFDNAIHTNIIFDCVAECPVLERGENPGGGYFVFRVRDATGWTGSNNSFTD